MKKLLIAGLAIALFPVVALAQKTTYDYDRSAVFSMFKTYVIRDDGTKVGQPLVDNRIVAAIDSELRKRGLTPATGTPDLAVVYHVAFDKQKDITAWSTGMGPYGYRWGGGWGTTDIRVNEILVGSLVIDMADAKKNEVVWRGVGTKEVDVNAKPDKRDKNIQQAVQKIMKNFPPPTKG